MSVKQIRLNAMRKVKEEVREYFTAEVRMFNREGQYSTASTQRHEGNKVLRVIKDLIKKEKAK